MLHKNVQTLQIKIAIKKDVTCIYSLILVKVRIINKSVKTVIFSEMFDTLNITAYVISTMHMAMNGEMSSGDKGVVIIGFRGLSGFLDKKN